MSRARTPSKGVPGEVERRERAKRKEVLQRTLAKRKEERERKLAKLKEALEQRRAADFEAIARMKRERLARESARQRRRRRTKPRAEPARGSPRLAAIDWRHGDLYATKPPRPLQGGGLEMNRRRH